jgi:hypothetical protein
MCDGVTALAAWLGLGFSLGWYYTITYYGRTGIPVPTPESCAALILYYFSVINVATEIQAIHWMVVFPVAGALWTVSLVLLAPRFGAERPEYWPTLRRVALCSLPLVVPGPWLMHIAGMTEAGFSWERMLAVALRRGGVNPWPGLNALYVGLGLVVVILEVLAYRRAFPLRGLGAWRHVAASGCVLILLGALVGAVVGMPLRVVLE